MKKIFLYCIVLSSISHVFCADMSYKKLAVQGGFSAACLWTSHTLLQQSLPHLSPVYLLNESGTGIPSATDLTKLVLGSALLIYGTSKLIKTIEQSHEKIAHIID